jgi:hypothetical protein
MKNTFLFAFLLFTLISNAQNEFKDGSYTSKNQEEFSGLIKIISEREIIFKHSIDSNEKILNAQAIQTFSFKKPYKKYISLSENNQPAKFFEYVIESDVSLLILDDTYYLKNETEGLNKLEVKKIETSTDQGKYESTINTYIGVLNNYSKNCKDLQSKVNAVKYNRKSLSKFVSELNACTNNDINDFSIDEEVVNLFEAGVTVGGNYANFEDTTTGGYKTESPSMGLGIGGFVSFSPNINKYNLSFLFGIEYNQKKVDYSYREPNFVSDRNIVHDASVIEPYLLALYQPFYNKKGLFSPYIGLGTSYGFTLSHEIQERDNLSEVIYERDVNQTFSLLYKFGTFINVSKNKFMFELAFSDYSYQVPGEAEDYGTNFQLKIGYVFNLK